MAGTPCSFLGSHSRQVPQQTGRNRASSIHSSGASHTSETLEEFRWSSACSPSLDLLQSGTRKKGKTQTKPRF